MGISFYFSGNFENVLRTYQNPLGPNQPRMAKTSPGTAGIPNEQTKSAQSFLANVIFLFSTTIKKATQQMKIHMCIYNYYLLNFKLRF